MSKCVHPFAALLALSTCGAQAAEEAPAFKPIASFAHYAIRQSSPFFSGEARSWMETSARLGGRLETGAFAFEAVALGLRTSGYDPYGSGSAPAGSLPGTPRTGNVRSSLSTRSTRNTPPAANGRSS